LLIPRAGVILAGLNTRRKLVLTLAYVVAYVAFDWLSLTRPAFPPGITPWHPQAGLTIAYLLAVGPAGGVATVLCAWFCQWYLRTGPVSFPASVVSAIWLGACATGLASWLKVVLAEHHGSTVNATRFAGGAALATFAGAIGYVCSFLVAGNILAADAVRGIARVVLADLNGILMVAPFFMVGGILVGFRRAWGERRAEILAQICSVLPILFLIFAMPGEEQLRFIYLLFVPVIWLALRWGWRGPLFAVLMVQAILIFASEAGMYTPRFTDTQLVMVTMSLTALLLGAVVDERRRSEQRLRERDLELSRAMRFAVAGELASATTHELNQPMTALVSYLNAAEILARAPGDDERLRATVRKAAAEALRASEVLHRLRNFYIGGRSRRERVNILSLAQAVAAGFTERVQRGRVALDVRADTDLPVIEGDETQLHIVLHNLVTNALDGVERRNGGTKRVEVRLKDEDGAVNITVEDSGHGIDATIADRLFEPFVTSKPDGMGLGLAISRTLVRARGGDLSASASEKLGGAKMRVVLPHAPAVDR